MFTRPPCIVRGLLAHAVALRLKKGKLNYLSKA